MRRWFRLNLLKKATIKCQHWSKTIYHHEWIAKPFIVCVLNTSFQKHLRNLSLTDDWSRHIKRSQFHCNFHSNVKKKTVEMDENQQKVFSILIYYRGKIIIFLTSACRSLPIIIINDRFMRCGIHKHQLSIFDVITRSIVKYFCLSNSNLQHLSQYYWTIVIKIKIKMIL